jgi:hypothetical protein
MKMLNKIRSTTEVPKRLNPYVKEVKKEEKRISKLKGLWKKHTESTHRSKSDIIVNKAESPT